MFFTKPNINFDQGWYKEPAAPDNPATNGEVFDTAWDASNRSELFGSSSRNLIDTYDAHNKRVEEITGKKFTNPATASFFEFETDDERSQFYKDFGSYTADGGSLGERGYAYRWKEQNYRRKLADLAEQFPDYRDQLLPETTFKERASAMARDSAAKAESAMERSGGGVLPQLASFGGSAMSGLTDPINIVTAPFGFGGVGTGIKGLAMGFLKTGASNAAVEAAVQPFVQADRSAAGMESGAAMGAANVGMAFAFGGALDLTIRGTARGLRWSLGYEPVVDAKGVVIGYKKIAPAQPVDPAAPAKAPDADPSFISKDLIDRADGEDPAAMRAVAEKSGLINEPLVRSTFDAMDANERMVGSRPSETIADGEHAKGIVQTLRHVNEPELEPLPVVRDGTTLDTIRGLDLDMAEVKAEIRLLKERAPDDAEGLAKLETRVAELRVSKFDAQREIMADDLIQAVDQGRMPQELADLVVDHVADKAIQGRVASDLAKMRPTSPTEARHRLAQILSSPDYRPEVPAAPARGNGLARPALDDPYGADAVKQVKALEQMMADELGIGKAPPTPEEQVKAVQQAIDRGDEVRKAISDIAGVVPEGVEIKTFSAMDDLPGGVRQSVEMANARLFSAGLRAFQSAGSAAERDAARSFLDAAKAGRGIEGIEQDGTIWIATYAMNPKGRVAHEVVHSLRTLGKISPDEIATLAAFARDNGLFGVNRAAKYRKELEARSLSEARVSELLDEEAAAHAVEYRANTGRPIVEPPQVKTILDRLAEFFAAIRDALRLKGFVADGDPAPSTRATDVLEAFMSGDMAKREATKAWMRRVMKEEDITAFAIRDDAVDDWEQAWWDRLGERSQTIDHFAWEADSKTALRVVSRNKSTPKAYVEQEADRLTVAVRSYERKLLASGLSGQDVADAISAHFGFPVNADDYARGVVWWRDTALKSDQAPAPTQNKEARSVGFDLTAKDREAIKAAGKKGKSVFEIAEKMSQDTGKYVSVGAVSQIVEPTAVKRAMDLSQYQRAYTAPDVAGLSAEEAASVLSRRLGRDVTPQAVRRGRQRAASKGVEVQGSAKSKDYERWTPSAKAALRSDRIMAMDAVTAAATLAAEFKINVSPTSVRVMRSREGLSRRDFLKNGPAKPTLKLHERGGEKYWVISDNGRDIWTGLTEAQKDLAEARIKDYGDNKPQILYAIRQDSSDVEAGLADALGRVGREEGQSDGAGDIRGGEGSSGGLRGARGADGQGSPDDRHGGTAGSLRERRRLDIGIPGLHALSIPGQRTASGAAQRFYYVLKDGAQVPSENASDKTALSVLKFSNNWASRLHLIDRGEGRWEVMDVRVRKAQRRRGIASALYDAIEQDLGIKMQPSGILKPDGYEFWAKRNPEAVKYHVRLNDGYVSPKQLIALKLVYNDIAERATDISEIIKAGEENAKLNKLLSSVPKEAMEPKVFNAMFAFAGERAKTADLNALDLAKRMTLDGTSRDEVWTRTGWFQGVDGKWRFEIDDSKADFSRWFNEGPVTKMFPHEGLDAAYPSVADIPVRQSKGLAALTAGGYKPHGEGWFGRWTDPAKIEYSPIFRALDEDQARGTMLHEIQHAIQQREGFARGASDGEYSYTVDGLKDKHPVFDHAKEAVGRYADALMELDGVPHVPKQDFAPSPRYADAVAALNKEMNRLRDENPHTDRAWLTPNLDVRTRTLLAEMHAENKAAREARSAWEKKRATYENRAHKELNEKAYLRSSGEVEARNVARRMDMTADERRATPPWLTQDLPDEMQLIQQYGRLSPLPMQSDYRGRAPRPEPEILPPAPVIRFGDGVQNSEPMFAIRQDQETGRSMRRDLDALGYYSGALEAAKGLKQAKGTPEQMFALAAEGKETMRRVASEGVTLPDGSNVQGVPLFAIRAFHGSRLRFEKFDYDRAGSTPLRGVGLYFSASRNIAAEYRGETGPVYEVRLNVERPTLIEWDMPLASQPAAVRAAFEKLGANVSQSPTPWTSMQGYSVLDVPMRGMVGRVYQDRGSWVAEAKTQFALERIGKLDTEADAKAAVVEHLGARGVSVVASEMAGNAYKTLARRLGSQRAASNALREAGVHGVEWPSGPIHGAGRLSVPNYTIFDDSLIEIVSIDGKPVGSEPMFAIRQDQDTGRALGYYSGALEAAKALKQAKGTPEQMLAQLKAGGAKQAELEATGLLKWIEGKSGSRESGADAGGGAVIDPAVVGPNGDRTSGTSGRADRLKQPSISKSEIVEFLEKNRVGVKEVVGQQWQIPSRIGEKDAYIKKMEDAGLRDTRWQSHSLDPSNPTYRETVIHLPESRRAQEIEARMKENQRVIHDISEQAKDLRANPDFAPLRAARSENAELLAELKQINAGKFQSGHFSEPNIIGHMMTSMTRLSPADEARLGHGTPTSPGGLKAIGKANPNRPTVYTIDQIQSDWGQKLRDGGVRDEKKIADIKHKIALNEGAAGFATAVADAKKFLKQFRIEPNDESVIRNHMLAASRDDLQGRSMFPERQLTETQVNEAKVLSEALEARASVNRLVAELRTAEAVTPGHPLVNTTDQWVNTTLRRSLRQAAEADADYIAIPHGDTVLSYNPGDVDGMRGFYGSRTSEGIVPKNLRKILEKLDKNAAKPQRVEAVETSDGVKGWNTAEKYPFDKEQTGFTLFPLTPEVKDRVLSEGQPLFAMRQDNGRKTPGSDSRKQYVKEDFDAIDAQFQKAGGDERLKLQAKRAALLNAKAHEKVSADIAVFQDVGGQTDPGKAMMFVVENQGQATFQGLATMRDIATQTDLAEMGKMMWQMRKGAVLGDKRRGTAPVKTMLHNVIREAWGQNTGDATAKEFAKALLSRMEARRQRWNHAGGDIKKLEGYAGPQYHDREAWASAGREEIVKYFVENDVLDRSRMISFETGAPMTDAELSDMLKGVWRNVVSDGAAAFEEGASASAGRPGAKYKQRMEHRVLHFKDADAWLAYNEKYGSGDVYASIVGEAITMNRDIALMERLGANPLLTWERLKADVIREAQNAVASKSLYDEFMGKIDDLRAKRAAIPNAFEALNAKMTKDMEALDQLRDEARTSKRKAFRNRPKIADLTRSLRETVLAIEEALKDGAQTAEQIAITTEIADLMTEMVDAGARNSMSRNPVERTQRLVKRADEMMKSYMGSANVPADDRLAAGMTATRNLLGASTLVYAPFSALADQTTQAMARLLTGLPLKSQITSYVKAFTKMDRQFALDTAIGLESVLPAIHESNRHVGSLNARHISGYVADRSHAFSFLSPMTTAAKIAFSFDFMKDFASIRGAPYTELGEIKQTLLDRHGISPAEWDQIRAAEPEMHRGREHLTHRAIAAAAGPELADKYLGMLYRERSYSTIEGLTRGRTAFVSDMQPGTAQGEALRSIAMFKSFPVSYGMLIFGRLYEEVMKGRAMQPSVIGAAASIFIGGTILGALVIQLKQIAQGKDPRDMTDPKFWAQAFMQSGGLGIYGDFVASSINRQGSGLAGTIAGPVADLGGNVLDLTFGNIAQYASDEKTNAGREAVKLMRRLTPGMIAPWYIRTAVDRMVFDELQKVLDPEAHRSFQSRMRTTKKVGGNDFFWAPGTSEPQRGPNMGAIFGR